MKKHKFTIREKLQYKFDEIMSGGIRSMAGFLILNVLLIMLLFALFLVLVVKRPLVESLWQCMVHMISPGTLAKDDGTWVYMLCMTVVTFVGIAVFGTLVGIINNGISTKIQDLKKGTAKVVEKGHIVILGFDDEIYKILDELIESNKDYQKGIIVILDGRYSVEYMREMVEKSIKDTCNTKIIYRSGIIYDINAISKCSIETCKSVIVNVESDSVTIKCILAVSNIIKRMDVDNVPHVTAVIRDSENTEAAMCAAQNVDLKLLNFDDIIAKIIAQSSRYQGVSELFEDLFGYDGSEIYIQEANAELEGVPIEDMALYYPKSVFIGKQVIRNDKCSMLLYPLLENDERIIHKNDKLMFIAENERAIVFDGNIPQIKLELDKKKEIQKEGKRKVLILRYSSKLSTVIQELYNINDEVEISIAVRAEYEKNVYNIIKKYPGKLMQVIPQDLFSKQELKALLDDTKPDSVIVLSNLSSIKDFIDMNEYKLIYEKEDSDIMLLLLKLRCLVDEEGYEFSITSEIEYSANQKLAQDTGVNDFIVGSSITNRILAQVAQEKLRYEIFNEIITAKGADILIKPVENYLDLHVTYSMTEVKRIIAMSGERNEVFVGYMRGKTSSYKQEDENSTNNNVWVNPQIDEVRFDKNDVVVLLGNNS